MYRREIWVVQSEGKCTGVRYGAEAAFYGIVYSEYTSDSMGVRYGCKVWV